MEFVPIEQLLMRSAQKQEAPGKSAHQQATSATVTETPSCSTSAGGPSSSRTPSVTYFPSADLGNYIPHPSADVGSGQRSKTSPGGAPTTSKAHPPLDENAKPTYFWDKTFAGGEEQNVKQNCKQQ